MYDLVDTLKELSNEFSYTARAIIGPRTLAQLKDKLSALEVSVDDEVTNKPLEVKLTNDYKVSLLS